MNAGRKQDKDFREWLDTQLVANDSVLRIWDNDRDRAVDGLYAMWAKARALNEHEVHALKLQINALTAALNAKQTIEVNFSIFGRKRS